MGRLIFVACDFKRADWILPGNEQTRGMRGMYQAGEADGGCHGDSGDGELCYNAFEYRDGSESHGGDFRSGGTV